MKIKKKEDEIEEKGGSRGSEEESQRKRMRVKPAKTRIETKTEY